jgi:hypothetical protein
LDRDNPHVVADAIEHRLEDLSLVCCRNGDGQRDLSAPNEREQLSEVGRELLVSLADLFGHLRPYARDLGLGLCLGFLRPSCNLREGRERGVPEYLADDPVGHEPREKPDGHDRRHEESEQDHEHEAVPVPVVRDPPLPVVHNPCGHDSLLHLQVDS